MENVEKTPGGRDAIWPGARKLVDAMRYRLTHVGTDLTPQLRWGDKLSPESRAQVDVILDEPADLPEGER